MSPQRPFRNFYGRRYGKRLRPAQRRLLGEKLASIAVPGISDLASTGERGMINTRNLFDRNCEIWLEVGFGSGEHMIHQAKLRPEIGIIGCEPFVNGVASCLRKLQDSPCSNVRIHLGDVRHLMDVLPSHSISRAFVLYPDPWPKKRHHRRRFVTAEFLEPLAQVLKPGSSLRLATDIADYARQAVEQISFNPKFGWEPDNKQHWQVAWDDWVPTRYEIKALTEGRTPIYLTFRRL